MKPQTGFTKSARGRTRCSASCLAHTLKRPHQPAYRPQVLPGWYFCLAGSILHPLVERERVSGTSRVGVWFLRSAKTLFFGLPPNRPQLEGSLVCHPKQSTIFIVLLPRTPTEVSNSCIEIHSFFCIQKAAHCIYRRLVPLFVWEFWFLGSQIRTNSEHPPKQDSHSEREAFSYHTYFISGKNNKLHIRRPAVVPGKRIQPTKLPTAHPRPRDFFLFDQGITNTRVDTKAASDHSQQHNTNNGAQNSIQAASLIRSTI